MKQNNLFKYGLMVIILLLGTINAFSQEVRARLDLDRGYGLFNNRTQKWVTNRCYQDGRELGSIDGMYYYSMKLKDLWGVMNEKGEVVVNFQFENIGYQMHNGFFPIKKSGSWGLADISNTLIIACEYESVYLSRSGVKLEGWRGEDDIEISMADLMDIRAAILEDINNQKEAKEKEEEEARMRLRKEIELSSQMAYAKTYIRSYLSVWAKKGEFEKMADYEARVNGPARKVLVDSLILEAKKSYISEYESLGLEDYYSLSRYDADKETFIVISSRFGELTLNVPIEDAPGFKSRFDSMEKERSFFVSGDTIALASLDIHDGVTDKTYSYKNAAALQEDQVDTFLKSILYDAKDLASALDIYDAKLLAGSWKSLNNSKDNYKGWLGLIGNFFITFHPAEECPLNGTFENTQEMINQSVMKLSDGSEIQYQFVETITLKGKYTYKDGKNTCDVDIESLDVKVKDFKIVSKIKADYLWLYESLRKKLPKIRKEQYRDTFLKKPQTVSTIISINDDSFVCMAEQPSDFISLKYTRVR